VLRQAQRLLAVGPGALRLLVYLGAADRLIGLEEMERRPLGGSTYRLALPAGLDRLPSGGPGGPGRLPDPELVLALAPDLLVAVALEDQPLATLAQRSGVPVLPVSYGTTGGLVLETFFESLGALGAALGRDARAAELTAFLRDSIAELARRTAGIQPQAAAYIGGISLQGAQGIGSTQAEHPPLAWAGVRNLAAGLGPRGHFFLDREQLLALDPPVLFVDGGGLPGILAGLDKERDFYARLRAVREGRVYLTLPFNAYNTNVENALVNAWAMACLLYPQACADLDLNRLASGIMIAFLGRDPLPEYAALGYGLGRLDLPVGRWTPLS
jgi:iron complex transport system substrate-binding protein